MDSTNQEQKTGLKRLVPSLKLLWLLLGFIMLGLAFLGIVLPLLPTVPFLLLAALFFAKSSIKIHTWLLNHKLFGTMIQDWHEKGAINKNSKYLATISIIMVLSLSIFLNLEPMIIYIQTTLLSLVLLFIWTRPNR